MSLHISISARTLPHTVKQTLMCDLSVSQFSLYYIFFTSLMDIGVLVNICWHCLENQKQIRFPQQRDTLLDVKVKVNLIGVVICCVSRARNIQPSILIKKKYKPSFEP